MNGTATDWSDAHQQGQSALKAADAAWAKKSDSELSETDRAWNDWGEAQIRNAALRLVVDNDAGTTNARFLDTAFTAEALQTTVYPPIKFVVPDYVPEGLTLLCGKPKRGKSWLALDWALAVAFGGIACGSIECEQGDVLFLALEDNHRRLQARLKQLLGDNPWPKHLTFQTEWPRLEDGGLALISEWIESAANPRFVVIDTLQKVRAHRAGSTPLYEADYAAAAPLQEMVGKTGIAALAIHHLRKSEAEDPLDMVSGSTGLTGAADTILVLDRDTSGPTLYGRGRDTDELEMAMKFDKTTGRWSVLGNADEARRSVERNQIIAVLKDIGAEMGPKDIASATGLSEVNVRQMCGRMVQSGELEKKGRGAYVAL